MTYSCDMILMCLQMQVMTIWCPVTKPGDKSKIMNIGFKAKAFSSTSDKDKRGSPAVPWCVLAAGVSSLGFSSSG